jgi:hypothetical protein
MLDINRLWYALYMPNQAIPTINYLDFIQADNAGTNASSLTYSALDDATAKLRLNTGYRLASFWNAHAGSLDETIQARQLGFEFFLATASKVIHATNSQARDIWADKYTGSSVALFGAPDKDEAKGLMAEQLVILKQYQQLQSECPGCINELTKLYTEILGDQNHRIGRQVNKLLDTYTLLAVSQIKQVLLLRFGYIFDLVQDDSYDHKNLANLFSSALNALTEHDSLDWKIWKVISTEKGTNISVDGLKQHVLIPLKRAPVDKLEAKKLLAHELLVHCYRAQNGKQSKEIAPQLLTGFPCYLEAEEGLAIIAGAAITGTVSDSIIDRYIDISLAMGLLGKKPMKRMDLVRLAMLRKQSRAAIEHSEFDDKLALKKTSAYVDRIYRGSPGDNIGNRQAVYTADIYYYNGFRKMSRFIAYKLQSGYSIDHIFDYVMQGKFDPTNPVDIEQVGALI